MLRVCGNPASPAPTWWLQDHHLREDEARWESWPVSCSERTRRLSSTLAGVHRPEDALPVHLNCKKLRSLVPAETWQRLEDGDRLLFRKVCVYPHRSKHLVALRHGIRWAAPPGTKAPAQSKSSRTTEETSLPLEQTTEPDARTPWHSQTWHPGAWYTISSCQVSSPAPLKPLQDLPAAFPRQPLVLSPTVPLLPIPPSPLPAPRLPFSPSSPPVVLPVSLARAPAHPLMPQPHVCPEASH